VLVGKSQGREEIPNCCFAQRTQVSPLDGSAYKQETGSDAYVHQFIIHMMGRRVVVVCETGRAKKRVVGLKLFVGVWWCVVCGVWCGGKLEDGDGDVAAVPF
jgi:hypothetical protein